MSLTFNFKPYLFGIPLFPYRMKGNRSSWRRTVQKTNQAIVLCRSYLSFLNYCSGFGKSSKKNRALFRDSYQYKYEDYIYVDKLGDRIKPGYITQHFPLVLKKHGLRRIRFHDLRHSCASLLLANGVSLKEIQ
ncbi:tyrosine-type recombinase/integrase [Paenibacillus durus]|uniref:tyrosine-type recombinase/integrase n=1 Tax=Paenibacillus durus TaxID=44251 RepID=UPI002E80EA26|nr:tyrosine-type recombinase/integrase [Paenibacillus durus]